jgi:hypothetical protein
MSGKEHIQAPQEDDDEINRTLRENLPENINDVDLGAKEQKGVFPSLSSPSLSVPLPFYSPTLLFLSFLSPFHPSSASSLPTNPTAQLTS